MGNVERNLFIDIRASVAGWVINKFVIHNYYKTVKVAKLYKLKLANDNSTIYFAQIRFLKNLYSY